MSSLVLSAPGLRQLCLPQLTAAELQDAFALPEPSERVSQLGNNLLAQMAELAALEWHFNVYDLRTVADEEHLRGELLAMQDYVRAAQAVASGSVGAMIVDGIEARDAGLGAQLAAILPRAFARLHEFDLALRFLLEDDDPTGELERAFAFSRPDPQRQSASVEFDFD